MIKNKKTMCKILSVFLAFLIVAQILPLQVLAENVTDALAHQQLINDALNNPTSEDNVSDAEILYEVEEKRDEYTKVYKKSDGTYTAVKTIEPLHYLKDDVWEEINNSMSLNGSLYTNLDNLFNVEFPESIDINENLTVEKDGYELSFSVDNIEESSAVVENDIVVSDTNITVADEAIAQTQSSVTYNDVAEDTNLQYIVTPNSIKENIIVSNKKSVKDTYAFTFETNGLDTEELDDGSVVFKDENDEIKFRIPRPVMTDSSLAYSYDINVVLIENTDDTITLEYSPSTEWINSSDRTYPITIDPAIHVENNDVSWVEDTWVAFDSSNSDIQKGNGYNDCIAVIANQTTTDDSGNMVGVHSEIYTKFNIDALKSLGDNIVFTEVQYLFVGASADGKALAKKIKEFPTIENEVINLSNVTYNTKPILEDEIIDYYTSPYSLKNGGSADFSYIHFNITKPLNEWYAGDVDNNGFAVVASNDEYTGLFVLNGVASPSSDTTYTTVIVMDYVDMGGYNENLNYHSQTVGRAGTGYVNDFTQQLSVIRDDLSIDGNIMPVTVGMIYNSATYDKIKSLNYSTMMAYGNKWTPNYLRAFVQMSDNQLTYFTESGSEIDYTYSVVNGEVVFEETYSDFYGEYGYEIEYFPSMGGKPEYIVITRPDGLEERFNELGLLTSVTNSDYPSQNINITYDKMYRIDRITDGVGRQYNYIYCKDTNLLSAIRCCSSECTHTISACEHTPIDVCYSEECMHDTTDSIHPATDCMIHKIAYCKHTDAKCEHKTTYCKPVINNCTPIPAGSTDFPLEINYQYDVNNNLIKVTFPDGKSASYTYDEKGNITSIVNIDGYRIVYKYDENGKITNITEQALDNNEYVVGNSFSYVRLSPTQIRFTDKNKNYETYQFNNNGTLLYTTDSNGNYAINNTQGSDNNSFYVLDNEYRTNSQNLLLNASFEDKSILSSHAKYWDDSTFERTNYTAYLGNYAYKASKVEETTAYQRQTVDVLSGGRYTFSAYVKSDNTNSGNLYLNISSIDSSNTKETETRFIESTGGEWQRYSVTIKAPSNTKKIVVEFGFKESKGTFYVDNVQLEQSSSATEYNLIENGGFRKHIDNWEAEATYSIVDTKINNRDEKAISISGNADGSNAIYQIVEIDGNMNDVFTIGGWSKGSFVKSTSNNPIINNLINDSHNNDKIFNFTNDRFAKIEVTYNYNVTNENDSTDTLTETITIPFCENIDDWQFAAKDFELKGDCQEVLVVIYCSKNANSISFSNIEFTKNNNAITVNDADSNSVSTKKCPCPTCEKPSCPCVCENETKCKCVTCMQKNTTILDDFGNITSVNSFDGIKTLQTLTRYTGDGNYVFAHTFADGTVLNYDYNTQNGLLNAIIDGKGTETSYIYDASTALTEISTMNSSAKYEYTNDKLTAITHNNFSYNLKYDCWGQLIEIAVEDQPIISYEYDEGQFRERIKRTKYHNSNSNPTITDYIYDKSGNITEILVNGDTQYTIKYSSLGSITEIKKSGCRTVCYSDFKTEVFDANNKLIYYTELDKNGETIEVIDGNTYDTAPRGGSFDSSGISSDKKDIFAYKGNLLDSNNTIDLSSVKTIGSIVEGDCFGRYVRTIVQTESVIDNYENNDFAAITNIYGYPTFEDDTTLNQVVGYKSYITYDNQSRESSKYYEDLTADYEYSYEYDANGNIITSTTTIPNSNGGRNIKYEYEYKYDELNQLVAEIDYVNEIKYVYAYDDAGNIDYKEKYEISVENDEIKKEELQDTIEYSYDNVWKDKLTSYNGIEIRYDNMGNPLSLNDAELSWSGTQLESYTIDDTANNITKQIRYSYDEQNLIHGKTVWIKPVDSPDESYQRSEQYDYTWTNGQLSSLVYTKNEDDGSSTSNTIKFIYDVMNTPYGFILNDKDKNMKVYLFIKNLQGDIVGIVNESGKTVLTYEYNSWGHPSEPNAMDDETIEQLKLVLPMTYRGYCYDYDSGLYFIQNRYYNPEIGRFINVDNINSLIIAQTVLDFNLFAYCGNNPITYSLKYKDKSEYLTIESNYAYNKSKSNIINSYIYRQNDSIGNIDGTDGIVSPLHFGNTKFGPNGCGIVATYNALIMLGNRTDIADINRECEINGVSVCGSISFYPAYLVRYFKSKGYTVYVTYDKNKFDNNNTIKNAKANIIYYTKPKNGHYVAFNYDSSNYWGYNVSSGSDVSARCIGGSINAFLDGNGYIGRIIISIY